MNAVVHQIDQASHAVSGGHVEKTIYRGMYFKLSVKYFKTFEIKEIR